MRTAAGAALRSRRVGPRTTRSTVSTSHGQPRKRPVGRGWSSTSETPVTGTCRAICSSSDVASAHPSDARGSSSDSVTAMRGSRGPQAPSSTAAPPWSDCLGRADRDHEIRLDERTGDPPLPPRVVEPAQGVVLDVVHDDRAAEVAGAHRREECLELSPAGTPLEPSGDEHRLTLGWDAGAGELVERRRERGPAGVVPHSRHGERWHVDDDRGAPAARRQELERLTGEREPQGFGDRSGDVVDRIERRRHGHDHRLVGQRDGHEA